MNKCGDLFDADVEVEVERVLDSKDKKTIGRKLFPWLLLNKLVKVTLDAKVKDKKQM